MSKEIEEVRRRLEIANHDYQEVTNLKTSLEKEIGTYRELLESQNGLRGYVDRIVQNAELIALERPAARIGGSTTISRTVINTSGGGGSSSGFNFGASTGSSGINTIISHGTRPASSFQASSSSTVKTFRESSSERRSGEY